MLIVCAGHAEGALEISSDGESEEWQPGVDLVTSVLGKSTKVEFKPGPQCAELHVSTPSPEEVADLADKVALDKALSNEKDKPKGKLGLVHDDGSPSP